MERVIYEGELYHIVHRYESGYCEIRKVKEQNNNSIILVKSTEIEEVKSNKE